MEKQNWSQELRRLRDLTDRTGILHEAQRLQLRYWPYLAFLTKQPSERKIEVAWDAGEVEAGGTWKRNPSITLRVKGGVKGEGEQLADRLRAFADSCRDGICSRASVVVRVNGRKYWEALPAR